MSADNTIVVLGTKRKDGQPGMEYRVAEIQAAENLTYQPDYPPTKPVLNRWHLLIIFNGKRVILDKLEALETAQKLEKESGYVEYGISFWEYPEVFFPATDAKRRRRAKYRKFLGIKAAEVRKATGTDA